MIQTNLIKQFSDYYSVLDVDVKKYSGEKAAVHPILYEKLQMHAHPVIVLIDGEHYLVTIDAGVPKNTLAVPYTGNTYNEELVLLATREFLLSHRDSASRSH